jgi:hypothetical protein
MGPLRNEAGLRQMVPAGKADGEMKSPLHAFAGAAHTQNGRMLLGYSSRSVRTGSMREAR